MAEASSSFMIMFGEDKTLLLIPAIMLEEEVSSYIPLSVEASFLNVAMLEKEEEANTSFLNTRVPQVEYEEST